MLDGTLDTEAFRAANCLRSLVIVLLLGLRKERFARLVAVFSELTQSSHCGGSFGFQVRFELVSFAATAFETVAELERAAVALAAVFARGAVATVAGRHGVCQLVVFCADCHFTALGVSELITWPTVNTDDMKLFTEMSLTSKR